MTSLSHRYKDLDTAGPDGSILTVWPDDDEAEAGLSFFEDGYKAGWDDALAANETDPAWAASQISQCLQDMAFTHREAYVSLNSAIKPLIEKIIEKLLPEMARKTMGAHIFGEISKLMDLRSENSVEITVAPENLDSCREIFESLAGVPFTLGPDPSLSTGQAYLRVNQTEREINLSAVLNGIDEALVAFYEQTKEKIKNG